MTNIQHKAPSSIDWNLKNKGMPEPKGINESFGALISNMKQSFENAVRNITRAKK